MASKHSKRELTPDELNYLSELFRDWANGKEPIPELMRKRLTDDLLTEFFGEESRPGTWDKACTLVPTLRANPLTDAFNLSKAWGWKLGKSRLGKLSDSEFIQFLLKTLPETDLINFLKRKSEIQRLIGSKMQEASKRGGKRKSGRTKESPEHVVKYVNELRTERPMCSDEQIYKLAGKKFGISGRTARNYRTILNKKG
jgi:hypothetical protein